MLGLSAISTLIRTGRLDEATRLIQEQLDAHAVNDELHRCAARLAFRMNKPAVALEHSQEAVRLSPETGANHAELGSALILLGRLDEAESVLKQALVLDPALAIAHTGLGVIATRGLSYGDAELHFVNAIQADPNDTASLCNLAKLLKTTGRGDEAAALMGPALSMLPDDIGVQWTGATMSNYAADLSPAQIVDRHRAFGNAIGKSVQANLLPPHPPDSSGKMRVGFLSPDMRRHSVAFFLLPLIEAMDRQGFGVTCYSLCHEPDAITARFQASACAWRNVSEMTDEQIVSRIHGDKIDVLIDCAGLFAGARPRVLAMRAAPIQATWLGYPNTTGIDQVDYRIVDAMTDPNGAEDLATEKLARLNGCFVCFDPIEQLPAIERDAPCDQPIRFGCFNSLSKYNDPMLDAWANILQAVPDARLVLKAAPLENDEVCDQLSSAFSQRGVQPDRIEMHGSIASQHDHRAMYNRIDIALDTFPYCGTTTTCEALCMGVPVVTLVGDSHPGRVGGSLLHAIGRSDWFAKNIDQYVFNAVSLAQDRDFLQELHLTLRQDVLQSSLCDAHDFARRFEVCLGTMMLHPGAS